MAFLAERIADFIAPLSLSRLSSSKANLRLFSLLDKPANLSRFGCKHRSDYFKINTEAN
jgi:hypothetical protein